jgi:hypothetical protein
VPLNEYQFPQKKIANVQTQVSEQTSPTCPSSQPGILCRTRTRTHSRSSRASSRRTTTSTPRHETDTARTSNPTPRTPSRRSLT